MRRNWIKVDCIFLSEEEYGQHIQKLCEKLHYTRNNKELWYNLTIFEDQTLATVWKLLSEIKSVSFYVCLFLWW